MEIGLEELGVQNGEFSKFSSMPPVEKQELVFTREKKKLKSVYFDSNGKWGHLFYLSISLPSSVPKWTKPNMGQIGSVYLAKRTVKDKKGVGLNRSHKKNIGVSVLIRELSLSIALTVGIVP
ncbi:hypothetical protein CFP56_011722 [Quercus suber]|uniref:Uncharacterized protein n=1 Tax=Quercus suber TaxID=58331 RepID=A0AAW0KX55_QUESU